MSKCTYSKSGSKFQIPIEPSNDSINSIIQLINYHKYNYVIWKSQM